MRPIILLALLAIACDTPPIEGPPGPPGPKGDTGAVGPAGPAGGSTVKSGTRLKAIVERSDDGASRWVGWWDSELDVPCERDSATNRCQPEAAHPSVTFSDAACTVNAMTWSDDNPRFGYCLKPDGSRGFFPPGARVSGAYKLEDGECVPAAIDLPSGMTWHVCGDLPEIPASAFAVMTKDIED